MPGCRDLPRDPTPSVMDGHVESIQAADTSPRAENEAVNISGLRRSYDTFSSACRRRSARRSIPAGSCWPAIWRSWPSWRCARKACFRRCRDEPRRTRHALEPHRHRDLRRRLARAGGGAVLGRPPRPAAARRNLRLRGAGQPVEPARRLCRPGVGRPAGLCRAWRLPAVRARHAARRPSARRHPHRRRRRGDRRGAGGGADLPPARRLFRHRHLGGGGSVPPARVADLGARRRLRHQPAGRHRHRRWRRAGRCASS